MRTPRKRARELETRGPDEISLSRVSRAHQKTEIFLERHSQTIRSQLAVFTLYSLLFNDLFNERSRGHMGYGTTCDPESAKPKVRAPTLNTVDHNASAARKRELPAKRAIGQ